jgi:hypothetical protein
MKKTKKSRTAPKARRVKTTTKTEPRRTSAGPAQKASGCSSLPDDPPRNSSFSCTASAGRR